jgi:hypothetical protein
VINGSASSGESFLQSNVKLDSRSKVLCNEGVIQRLRSSDSNLKDLSKNQFLKILHQNIRGLKHKVNEFLCHLPRDPPHVLCFTEHHLRLQKLSCIRIENYLLGSNYCRQSMHKGGVSIFIYKHLPFISINLVALC